MRLVDGHTYRLGRTPVAAVDCPPLGCFVLRALSGDALWQVSPDGAIRPLDGSEQPAPPCAHIDHLPPYEPGRDEPEQLAKALTGVLAARASALQATAAPAARKNGAHKSAAAGGVALDVAIREAAPAATLAPAPQAVEALRCPQCGAPAALSAVTGRATTCSFCGSRLQLAGEAFRADTAILATRVALDHHEATLKRLLGEKAALMAQWTDAERRAPRGLSQDALKLGVTLLFIAMVFGGMGRSWALTAPLVLWVIGAIISLVYAHQRRARIEQQTAATLTPPLTALGHEIAAAQARVAQLRAELDRLTR